MAKRKEEYEELDNFVTSEPIYETFEITETPNLEEAVTLKQDEVVELIKKNEETNFVQLAKLYHIGKHGFIALNLETKEKRVVPNSNIYFATSGKRFAMTQNEWNELVLLKDYKL